MPEPTEPPEDVLRAIGAADEEPMDTYRWATGMYFLGLAALMCVFGAGVALFGWMGFSTDDRNTNLAGKIFGALCVLAALYVAWTFVKHYRTTATRVYLYESGLVWYEPATGWGAGRWADAVTFYRSETRGDVEEASCCSVEFRDGAKVRFAAQLKNYQGLASHVQKLMHRALFPVLKARYAAGESIEFGRIVLTPTEFISKAEPGSDGWRCPLAKIREAEVAHGALWLNHITNRQSGFMTFLALVPNYTVLLALLPFKPKNWVPEAFE